ncbi:hypothetical protein EDB85DRAFT_1901908 [Lactarius pseudohatsudake]|nr:hypothetical protein EDB85DRAFT_1901908 [Lactarius pseudohatsudake]
MYSHLPSVLSSFVAGTLGQPLITRGMPFQPRAGSFAAPLDTVASRDLITVLSSCNGLDYTVVPALTVKNGGLCFLGGGPENATFGNDPSNPIRGEPQYPNMVPCVLPKTCVDPSFATLEDPELPAPWVSRRQTDKPEETLDGLEVTVFILEKGPSPMHDGEEPWLEGGRMGYSYDTVDGRELEDLAGTGMGRGLARAEFHYVTRARLGGGSPCGSPSL